MEKLLICFVNIYIPKWGENEFIIFGWRVLEKEKANRYSLISQYKSKKIGEMWRKESEQKNNINLRLWLPLLQWTLHG